MVLQLVAQLGRQVRVRQRVADLIQLRPELSGQIDVHRSPSAGGAQLHARQVGIVAIRHQAIEHVLAILAQRLGELGMREGAALVIQRQRAGDRVEPALGRRLGGPAHDGIRQAAILADGADQAVERLVGGGSDEQVRVLRRDAVRADPGLDVGLQLLAIHVGARHEAIDAPGDVLALGHRIGLERLVDAVPARRVALQHVGHAIDNADVAHLGRVLIRALLGTVERAVLGGLVVAQCLEDVRHADRQALGVRLELGDLVGHATHGALDGVNLAESPHRRADGAENIPGAASLEIAARQEFRIPDFQVLQGLLIDRRQGAGDVVRALAEIQDVRGHVRMGVLEGRVGHALCAQEFSLAEDPLAEATAVL